MSRTSRLPILIGLARREPPHLKFRVSLVLCKQTYFFLVFTRSFQDATMAQSEDQSAELIEKVSEYVKQYMSHYDGSHDYNHILRVLGLARLIAASSPSKYDPLTVTLAALLHDVGDKKYLKPGQDSGTLVQKVLVDFGVEDQFAQKLQIIVTAVSFSSEIKNPERVREVIALYPELAVVQDADRLDALGAFGIGRTFTYGGAAGSAGARGRGMGETIEHFTEKLERLEGMMKTEVGRQMARERTQRLKLFREWWAEELQTAEKGLSMDGSKLK